MFGKKKKVNTTLTEGSTKTHVKPPPTTPRPTTPLPGQYLKRMYKNVNELIAGLDHSKGGIPATGRVNKNRQVLIVVDREHYKASKNWKELDRVYESYRKQIRDAFNDLLEDKIDTVIIDVKERTW